MALEIKVISGPKGSNPGGKCVIPSFKNKGMDYIKYCNVNDVSPLLDVQNQPIYEAISLEMAKKLGLSVPEYEVIVNPHRTDVRFSYSPLPGEKVSPLNSKKSCYFLSRFIPHNVDDTHEGLPPLMAREKIFRDLLNLGDISGRAQNYSFIQPKNAEPFVTYIDVGCGLVDAHEGHLSIRTSLRNKLKKVKGKKDLRNIKNRLSRWEIETPLGKRINLEEFGESIPEIPISVLDASRGGRFVKTVPARVLLSLGELDQLQLIYFVVNERFLKKYSGDERLSRARR